jgi:hypothetical protein
MDVQMYIDIFNQISETRKKVRRALASFFLLLHPPNLLAFTNPWILTLPRPSPHGRRLYLLSIRPRLVFGRTNSIGWDLDFRIPPFSPKQVTAKSQSSHGCYLACRISPLSSTRTQPLSKAQNSPPPTGPTHFSRPWKGTLWGYLIWSSKGPKGGPSTLPSFPCSTSNMDHECQSYPSDYTFHSLCA